MLGHANLGLIQFRYNIRGVGVENNNVFYSGSSTHYENTPIQIYRKFHFQKLKIFRKKTLIFFIFLLKTQIVGTR